MSAEPARRSAPWWNGIHARVVAMLSVALLPIGLVAVWQTLQVAQAARDSRDVALLALTEASADEERLAIERAFGAGAMLASLMPDYAATPERCTAGLAEFVAREPQLSFVGVLPLDGLMRCSSNGETHDFSAYPRFAEAMANRAPFIEVNAAAPFSQTSILIASHPFELDGAFAGFVSVSIPQSALADKIDSDVAANSGLLDLITVNADGLILTGRGSDADTAALLPDLPDMLQGRTTRARVFTAPSRAGRTLTYTLVPVPGSPLSILGVWEPSGGLAGDGRGTTFPTYLFPALMWFVSIVVSAMAMNTLVIRHIASLQRNMDTFATSRALPTTTDRASAPNEIAALKSRFAEMAGDVLQDEARQEAMLREKNVLLKEVHHRVKNNLQMIASIMNFQIRSAEHEETVRDLQKVQDRISSLVSIYRDLYTLPDGGRVDVGKLIRATLEQTLDVAGLPRARIDVAIEVDSVHLYPDQAVPISLLAAETATNAIKYLSAPKGQKARLEISLRETDGMCHYRIRNQLSGPVEDTGGTGVGSKLIRAFAIKLGGQVETDQTGDFYELRLSFPIAEFQAEPLDY